MRGRTGLWLLAACVLWPLLARSWEAAGVSPLPPNVPQGCQDLATVPMQFNVNYAQVHEVWVLGGCTSCHNINAVGGLRLDVPHIGIVQLVLQPSFQNGELIRAIPRNPDYSLVYQLLNCSAPPGYIQMPPSMGGTRIPIELRARVFDWLAQGARGSDEDGNPVSDVVFVSAFESQRFQRGLP